MRATCVRRRVGHASPPRYRSTGRLSLGELQVARVQAAVHGAQEEAVLTVRGLLPPEENA